MAIDPQLLIAALQHGQSPMLRQPAPTQLAGDVIHLPVIPRETAGQGPQGYNGAHAAGIRPPANVAGAISPTAGVVIRPK